MRSPNIDALREHRSRELRLWHTCIEEDEVCIWLRMLKL
jgi:hypothetical protein